MTRPVALVMALLAGPAFAQGALPCQPYTAMAEALRRDWGEVAILRGLDARGRMIEIYVGPQGTFTILAVAPDMTACPLSVGGAVEVIRPKGNL